MNHSNLCRILIKTDHEQTCPKRCERSHETRKRSRAAIARDTVTPFEEPRRTTDDRVFSYRARTSYLIRPCADRLKTIPAPSTISLPNRIFMYTGACLHTGNVTWRRACTRAIATTREIQPLRSARHRDDRSAPRRSCTRVIGDLAITAPIPDDQLPCPSAVPTTKRDFRQLNALPRSRLTSPTARPSVQFAPSVGGAAN